MDFLKLKTNVPVNAKIKDTSPSWEGENKFGTYQFNFNVMVEGREYILSLSDKSPAREEIKMFKAGDDVTIIKQEIDNGRKAIHIHPKGDIAVQPQNIGIPTGKENWNNHERKVKQEDKDLEYKKNVSKGNCMNMASRIIAAQIIKDVPMDDGVVNATAALTNQLCRKFHPDLFPTGDTKEKAPNTFEDGSPLPDLPF